MAEKKAAKKATKTATRTDGTEPARHPPPEAVLVFGR
jgi:hypothetical protein